MQLVNGKRGVQRVRLAASAHPFGVFPLVVQRPYDRTRTRRNLAASGERIRLLEALALSGADLVLVDLPAFDTGARRPPDPRGPPGRQAILVAAPAVEVPYD